MEPSTKATDSLEIDEAALLRIFDLLKVHLYKNIDPSRFNERYYPQADLVFGFDEYYLQFIRGRMRKWKLSISPIPSMTIFRFIREIRYLRSAGG
jgi:hypothetical protein